MKHRGDLIPIQRFLETTRAEEGEDFGRFAGQRFDDRGVVQHGDALCHAQLRQCRLQFQRFVDRLMHEGFDGTLAPGTEGMHTETAAEALTPAMPSPCTSHESPSSIRTPISRRMAMTSSSFRLRHRGSRAQRSSAR